MPQNPVTFYGVKSRGSDERIAISLGRLWIGPSPKDLDKFVSAVVWDPDVDPEGNNPIATAVFDEDHIIKGLKLLFPLNVELSGLQT